MKFRTALMHRSSRLLFVRFLHEEFGLNIQTAYGKLRRMTFKRWEREGIASCIKEYDSTYAGPLDVFYISLHKKKLDFLHFMEKKGMCYKTACIRFRKFDFGKLELEGYDTAYQQFRAKHPDIEHENK